MISIIDTSVGSRKGHYVNRAVHALLNATGDSIGITESSRDDMLSVDLVWIP